MQRDKTIDIAKGICIILMVMGHSGSPLTHFIYLFHMACFFIISGYCYKDSYNLSIKDVFRLVVSRLKTLYVPYVFINIVYLLMHNVFFKIGFITNNEFFLEVAEKSGANTLVNPLNNEQILRKAISICLFIGDSNFAGSATWFLRVLFIVNILFAFLMLIFQKVRHKDVIVIFISLCLLLVSWYLTVIGISDHFNVLAAGETLILFNVGYLINKMRLFDKLGKNMVYYLLSSVLVLCVGSVWSKENIEAVSIATPYITNPLFYLIMSVSGFIAVKIIAQIICNNEMVAYVFEIIGKHTIAILGFHFLIFKLITYLIIVITNQQHIMLASYPVLYFRNIVGGWWILYSIAGVCVPVALACGMKNINMYLKDKRTSEKKRRDN